MRLMALALLLTTSPVLAQTRPLHTEEASTPSAGTLWIEAGVAGIRDVPNFASGARRSLWDVPELRLVYSPAGAVELGVAWTSRVIAVHDPELAKTVSDFGDVVLRAKWRFLEARPGRPALAARVVLMLPETSFKDGLGPDTLRTSAELLASRTLGPVSLHANAGLGLDDRPTKLHAQADFFVYRLAVAGRVAHGVEVLGEIAGRAIGPSSPGAAEHCEVRLGLRYNHGRLRWDAALRRGLLAADGTWGAIAGLSWRIRPRS